MNDDLLSELRVAHADRIDDTLMVCDLRHPRTGVETLSQSAHQREGIKRNDKLQSIFEQEWISGFRQDADMKALNAINHAAHVVGFHRKAKIHHGGFHVGNRQFLLDDDARRQTFERSADLVGVNDRGIGQSENASAATVALGYKSLGNQNVQSLAHADLRSAEFSSPTPFYDFLAWRKFAAENGFTELGRQTLFQ